MSKLLVRVTQAAAATALAAATAVALPTVAGASQVPASQFTCGVTVFAGCDQTAQITTPTGTSAPEVGSPNPAATNCGPEVAKDAPVVVSAGPGSGVEHAVYSADGLTNMSLLHFTGIVTITAWIIDAHGNLVAPDPATQPSTGLLIQNINQTTQDGVYGTYNLELSFSGVHPDGTPSIYNDKTHATWPASPQQPFKFFQIASCG
jgi:hypothetical protein